MTPEHEGDGHKHKVRFEERATGWSTKHHDEWLEMRTERDKYAEEWGLCVERANTLETERDAAWDYYQTALDAWETEIGLRREAEAEVKRLDEANHTLTGRYLALVAENKRLRVALETLVTEADRYPGRWCTVYADSVNKAKAILDPLRGMSNIERKESANAE